MLKSVTIENFNMFDNFTIGDLSSVNLIVGKNGIGKTSLLEAISLVANPSDINIFSISRGYYKQLPANRKHFKISSIADADEESTLEVISDDLYDFVTLAESKGFCRYNEWLEDLKSETFFKVFLKSSYEETDFTVHYMSDCSHLPLGYYSRETNIGKSALGASANRFDTLPKDSKMLLLETLKGIFSYKVCNSSISIYNDIDELFFTDAGVALARLGLGFSFTVKLLYTLLSLKNGIIVLNNFGSELHYSLLTKVWGAVFSLAKEFNIQVFVTTHSKDVIESFSKVWKQNEDCGSFYRIALRKKGLKAVYYNYELLSNSIEADVDVR